MRVEQEGDLLRCATSSDLADSVFVKRYFRLDENLNHILASISRNRIVASAVQRYYGLRLVSQDPWECLASFVLAANANIPRITKMVSAVCDRYGLESKFEGEAFRTFPTPDALASASTVDLRRCGLGYRAPFLKLVAASVAEGRVDFAHVASLPYNEAREELLRDLSGEKVLPGVGPKVADCVLLYSCGKDEAFPIDVWIARVLVKYYPRLLDYRMKLRLARNGKLKLSPRDYAEISNSARRHFGTYAGYAQQYLFMAARGAEI